MGHWSESLIDEATEKLGGSPDRRMVADLLAQAAREIEILSGRSFPPPRRTTSTFEPNGLPFVDIPDMQVGSMEPIRDVWAVPDPIDQRVATVLQVASLAEPSSRAAPTADALWIAGQIVAQASQAGLLSGDYVLHWLGAVFDHEQRRELFRRVMDPAVRLSVPILGHRVDGWWIQLARRLIWVTNESEDEGRLLELLLDRKTTGGEALPLAAVEPILIVARMTKQPTDWAFMARIWTEDVQLPADRSWAKIAKTIHGHGVPAITIDPNSTPQEIACQVLLKGYWHGYIHGDEPALATAVAEAYPKQVQRIRKGTNAPGNHSAATTLLEQLIRPGFDPAKGAEATRRYVRRKASIAVMEHRKREAPERYPWTQIGITERHFYKLLPLFAEKVDGRYVYDHDDVVARIKVHLDAAEKVKGIRVSALDVLRSHGFGEEAARKWLLRHRPEQAVSAWPRGQRH